MMIQQKELFRNTDLKTARINTIGGFILYIINLNSRGKSVYTQMSLAALFIIGFSAFGFGQNKITEKKKFDHLVYIEADPFAYINKGYSIHLGYENWGMRFDLTKVIVDFPESFEKAFYGTKAFDLISKINGVKIDYIGNRSNWTKNAFVGLDVNAQKLNFRHRFSNEESELKAFNVGIRTGYKINIFKGFYITPWAAVWKNIADKQEYIVNEDKISTNEWDWIATLHLGYAIKL